MKRVAVIMGSDSDLPVVSGCAAKLDELGINYEMRYVRAQNPSGCCGIRTKRL